MPFESRKDKLQLTDVEREMLQKMSQARTEEYRRVERARMLLHYADGLSVTKIAATLQQP